MAWTLRVTDDMITNWHTTSRLCPLAQALEQELLKRGTEPAKILNANYLDGKIAYRVGGYWYAIYPTSQDTEPARNFVRQVDLELYPRKRVFHYGNPQSYYPGQEAN